MARSALRILEEVSRTGIDLLLQEPFYAHLLSGLNKAVVGPGHPVETLAVGMGQDSLTLYVNATFWDEALTQPQHRCGVLKHELLHLVFRHPFVYEPTLDPLLLNVAFDLVVNQYIKRSWLPDDSLFLDTFANLHLEAEQTWFYYYKKLEELYGSKGSQTSGEERGELPYNLRSNVHGLERHKPWRDIRSRNELDRSVAERHLKDLLQLACQRTSKRSWGALPGTLREALQQTIVSAPAQVPWRQVLRLFVASATQTRLKNTISRPSKRYGTTPGLRILNRKRHLLVAIDTSGSIGQQELDLFFHEVHHLWRAGARVELLETDVCVQRRYLYQGQRPQFVSGRGGTDFNDALQLANAEHPDGLIFFTDGYAGAPIVRPRVPVLWVISPNGIDAGSHAWEHLPGRRVKMRQLTGHMRLEEGLF